MTLPEFITDFFTKIETGILSPVLSGITYIAPLLLTIMLIGSFIWIFFASRKGPAVGTFIGLLAVYIYFGMLPDLVSLLVSWFAPNSTVDLSSATNAYNDGLQNGYNAIQGK